LKRLTIHFVALATLLFGVLPLSLQAAEPDVLISDFEADHFSKKVGKTKIYEGWAFEGDAFGGGSRDALHRMRHVSGQQGRHFISSRVHDDRRKGSVTTPPFVLNRRYVRFLIGGGDHPGWACVNLLVGGRVVRSATGQDDDRLEAAAFDVQDLKGQTAQLQVLDRHEGEWGHINVDHIVLTDRARTTRIFKSVPKPVETQWAVQSFGSRTVGPLALSGAEIVVGKKAVQLEDLLYAIGSVRSVSSKEPHEVRLRSGERWGVEIIGFEKAEVLVRSNQLGHRRIPIAAIASLDYQPGRVSGLEKPGTMYMVEGEPIPGKLVWIKSDTVAISCALGVIPVKRDRIRRFVLAAQNDTPPTGDEIGLVGGGVLHGTLGVAEGKWLLTHVALGELKLDPKLVRHVRRRGEHVTWLETLGHEVTSRIGPVGPPPEPQIIDGVSESDGAYLRAVRVLPRTVVRYDLPKGKSLTFRAMLAPIPGANAITIVIIRADGKTIWEKHIGPTDEPVAVTVKVPSTDHVELEVGFGSRLAFPSGVDWRDAHIVSRTGG
jgi:hypothetical protein